MPRDRREARHALFPLVEEQRRVSVRVGTRRCVISRRDDLQNALEDLGSQPCLQPIQHGIELLLHAELHSWSVATRELLLEPPSSRAPVSRGGLRDESDVARFALGLRLLDVREELSIAPARLLAPVAQPSMKRALVDASGGRGDLEVVARADQIDNSLCHCRIEFRSGHRALNSWMVFLRVSQLLVE